MDHWTKSNPLLCFTMKKTKTMTSKMLKRHIDLRTAYPGDTHDLFYIHVVMWLIFNLKVIIAALNKHGL